MKPHYEDQSVQLHHGDCLEVLRQLPDSSVDSVCTDPPYGIRFMGKAWDGADIDRQYAKDARKDLTKRGNAPGSESSASAAGTYDVSAKGNRAFQEWCELWAAECLRVLKPGGVILAFGGTRTSHRLACAIEDAGFEIRDSIAWLYSTGFPKSLNVSKAIDKAAGALAHESTRFTVAGRTDKNLPDPIVKGYIPPAPATPAAARWQGWGTALKPAFEPIVVGRKPLIGTVAACILAHGTGALNIDGCRVGYGAGEVDFDRKQRQQHSAGAIDGAFGAAALIGSEIATYKPDGRWPPNVVLDDSQAAELDRQTGVSVSRIGNPRGAASGEGWGMTATGAEYDDQGGASRFFPTFRYEAKAPTSERPRDGDTAHPTVKPLDLMCWLVRLVTPPGGTVLDPFAGSGTTAEACVIEGFKCIAIEREATYLPLIVQRLSKPIQVGLDFGEASA